MAARKSTNVNKRPFSVWYRSKNKGILTLHEVTNLIVYKLLQRKYITQTYAS